MKFVYAVGTFRSTLHKISSGLCWPSRYLLCWLVCLPLCDCLIGLVVKASALRTVDPGFESCTVCTLGATLPHAWCCRVRDGTVWPSVSILWLGEVDLGFDSRYLPGDFSGSSHISDLKIGTPVATLPCAWHCRVSAGTGWPGVSILGLAEMESLTCNFCLSVAAHADPSQRYTSMLLGRWATSQ